MTPGLSRARPLDGLTDFAVLARGDGAVKLVLNDKSGVFVELMPVSEVIPELDTPVWMLTHPDLRQMARVRAFMQHVGDAIAQQLSG